MWHQIRPYAIFGAKTLTLASLTYASGITVFLATPLGTTMGWPLFSANLVVSALGLTLFNILKRAYTRSQGAPEPILAAEPDPVPIQDEIEPETALELKDRIIQTLIDRNDHLGVAGNAISDAVCNEARSYVELAYQILGDAFIEEYTSLDTDDILGKITYLLPEAQDSDAAAIARKLELPKIALDALNNPDKTYEDGKVLQSDRINRHINGFHANFYWSNLHPTVNNLPAKLCTYAQHQYQTLVEKYSDPLVCSIKLFDWIAEVDSNFDTLVTQAITYHQQAELAAPIVEAESEVEVEPAPITPALQLTREQLRERRLAALDKSNNSNGASADTPRPNL